MLKLLGLSVKYLFYVLFISKYKLFPQKGPLSIKGNFNDFKFQISRRQN
jgi:hypothetical protein